MNKYCKNCMVECEENYKFDVGVKGLIIIVTISNYQYMMLRCSIVVITTNYKLVGKILRMISG